MSADTVHRMARRLRHVYRSRRVVLALSVDDSSSSTTSTSTCVPTVGRHMSEMGALDA